MSSTVTVIVTTVLNIGTPSSYKNKNQSMKAKQQKGVTASTIHYMSPIDHQFVYTGQYNTTDLYSDGYDVLSVELIAESLCQSDVTGEIPD